MSCYYDFLMQACVCENKIENIPVSELIYFFIEVFNV